MHASGKFSVVAAFLSMVTLGPKATIGFAEVPSPGAAGLANTIASWLGVDLTFLLSGTGMAFFPLELAPWGEVTGTLSRLHFSRMTIPLVGGVNFIAELTFLKPLLFYFSSFSPFW